jgi:hypothetical protein
MTAPVKAQTLVAHQSQGGAAMTTSTPSMNDRLDRVAGLFEDAAFLAVYVSALALVAAIVALFVVL